MSIVLILLGLFVTASVLCAATIFACAAMGGRSVAADLSEEPLQWQPASGGPAAVETAAQNHF